MLTQLCADNDLVQLVKKRTRSQIYITDGIKVTKESLLDHVYVDDIYSDQDLLTVKMKGRKLKTLLNKVYTRDCRNYSSDKFLNEIRNLNWDAIYYTTGQAKSKAQNYQ
jgi:hypothetical protein